MDLRWWIIAVAWLLCLAVAAGAAWLMPVERIQRALRPLAHVDRLTKLPEFARVQRIYLVSMAITAALLVVAFIAAIFAAARPVQLAATDAGFDAAHPRDVMLCVGQPVTDPTTSDFLNYYADQIASSSNGQIGLTSASLRVIPMTRDRDYAEQRLRYFAGLAKIQQNLDTHQPVTSAEHQELAAGMEAFATSVTYVDYAQGVEDALALCIAGFPGFTYTSERRRQLIYIGYGQWRGSNDKRPTLYDSDQVQAMAQRGGIQLNAIVRADVAESSPEINDALRALIDATGGTFDLYNPAGTANLANGPAGVLRAALDAITDNPPQVVAAGGSAHSERYFDRPGLALGIAVTAVALLSVSLAVVRR